MSDGRERETVWLSPGADIPVRFECDRCEGYRWRAVNPYRNVRRALKVLAGEDMGGITAEEFLRDALEDLDHLCQHDEIEGTKTPAVPLDAVVQFLVANEMQRSAAKVQAEFCHAREAGT